MGIYKQFSLQAASHAEQSVKADKVSETMWCTRAPS